MPKRRIRVRFEADIELERAWGTFLRHQAYALPLEDPPGYGEEVELELRMCRWPTPLVIQGKAIDPSAAMTVLQLEPLTPLEAQTLVQWGVDPDQVSAVLARTRQSSARGSASNGAAEASTASAPREPAPSPAAAEPAPSGPTPTPAARVPPVAFAPQPPTERAGGRPRRPPSTPSRSPDAPPLHGTFPPPAPPKLAPAPPSPAPAPQAAAPSAQTARPAQTAQTPSARTGRATPAHPGQAPWPAQPAARPVRAPSARAGDDLHRIAALSGPATHDTERALPALQSWGDLGKEPWRDALLRFLTERATGIVVIHAFRETRWAYFVDGQPVHYTGDQPHLGEFLSDALIEEKLITPERWKEALLVSKFTGTRPADFLLQRGWLDRDALGQGLLKRAERITERLLSANFGKWSFHPLDNVRFALPHPAVDVLPLLFAAERRLVGRLSEEEVIEASKEGYTSHVSLAPGWQKLVEGVPLRDDEQALLHDYLPAGWVVRTLVTLKPMHEQPLLRFLLMLRRLHVLDLVDDEGDAAPRNRAERKLFRGLREIEGRPPFEAIHCHWTSTGREVEEGYQRVLKEWNEQRFADVMDERLRSYVARIHGVARKHYEALKTKEGRDEERGRVISPSQQVMAIDLLGKQVEMEVFKTRWGVARLAYERIVELAPSTPEGRESKRHAQEQLKDPRIAKAEGVGSDFDRLGSAIDEGLG